MQPVGVDKGMAGGGDDLDVLHADAFEFFGEPLGSREDIRFVFGKRGDGGYAEEGLEFVKEAGVVAAGVVDGGGGHESS